jgi:hypothetical protein
MEEEYWMLIWKIAWTRYPGSVYEHIRKTFTNRTKITESLFGILVLNSRSVIVSFNNRHSLSKRHRRWVVPSRY